MQPPLPISLAAAALLLPCARAQGPAFSTPGMPRVSYGQTDRFSSEFNPAFGAALDLAASWRDVDVESGFDLTLRAFELNYNAWVDPDLWSYASVVADTDEIELEEAAVEYVGFGDHSSLLAGQFFVDFGKQMQAHVHELAYFDRPGVLQAYLGEELAGVGLQYDNWFAIGDASALRFSLAALGSLKIEADENGDVRTASPELKDLDELAYTARVTGFSDVGESGTLQWGLSGRLLPSFSVVSEPNGLTQDGLGNHVAGVDLTLGSSDETGIRSWTVSGEYLFNFGDLGATVDDPDGTPGTGDETLVVQDGTTQGFYAWLDRRWHARNAAGLLVGGWERPEPGEPRSAEYAVYYTHNLSEFSRLRLQVGYFDNEQAPDELGVFLQFTNVFGAHAHKLNW